MRAAILGTGWVTPLGSSLENVWAAVRNGAVAETKPVQNPESGRVLPCRPVPPKTVEHLGRNPRLRRSSPISYFAVAAAMEALAAAGITLPAPQGTAVVFAVSNGGVLYTRKFYEQIAKQGANAASPLLFPETVYNAPASHLAAALGIDGASYTLVGDSSVGLSALHFAAQLLAMNECERVLVAGCEEIDWILCEAFHDWRLTATPLAEGAAAVVLARTGAVTLDVAAGASFDSRRQALSAMQRTLEAVPAAGCDLVMSCANRTFVDAIESAALADHAPNQPRMRIKESLGEAPGASALWQIVAAQEALRHGVARAVLVPVIGFNQQASAAVVAAANHAWTSGARA